MNVAIGTGERRRKRHPAPGPGAGGTPPVEGSAQSTSGSGDATATLTVLYERHWSDLVQYVNGMLSDVHQAEEIVQETMLRAWRHADKLTPERGSVWGWLTSVAHNVMVDRIRHRRARPAEVNESLGGPSTMVTADHSPDVANAIYVASIVAQLPPAQRQVLHLMYFQDRTCAEAAAILGVPVGTVKSRVHYALRQLRTTLAEEPTRHD
jgi:RNA polymerase sigma-70 factor, ECF subfamily